MANKKSPARAGRTKNELMKVLIVSGTGQLGYTICEKLTKGNYPYEVMATYREGSDTKALKALPRISLVDLDLTQPESFDKALQGVSTVILTANTAAPSRSTDSFSKVDEQGACNFIDHAKKAGIIQFIYISAFMAGDASGVPLSKAKKKVEAHLQEVGITYTIFQPTAFMEVYFPFFGTTLPIRNSRVNTIERPFKFSNKFFAGIKDDIEIKGRFNIIGNGEKKSSFISVQNVADFCINAIQNTIAYNSVIPIGGPEEISSLEIKQIFEGVYKKKLKIKSTPPNVMKMMSHIFKLFNPAAANIFALNYKLATDDAIIPDAKKTADAFGVHLISAKAFIESKL
jgi:NADH dehydrogenase